tara:strand:+ start:205 stop:450 length:246 start_codon:yes stop_codon:yes gene_type:complete
LSIDRRRIEQVLLVIRELTEQGRKQLTPADVAEQLRSANSPMPLWQLRADFSQLAAAGEIELDQETATWRIGSDQSLKNTG